MTATRGRHRATRTRRLDVVGLGLVALALVLAAALLAPGGVAGTLRTVLGVLALLVLPGWLVGRLVDEDGEAIARLVGGTVATLGVLALSGFLAFELGLRVATAVVAVPLLVLVALSTLLGAASPRPRAPLSPLLGALALGTVALLGAMGTHLVLPATPIESAFSIQAAQAVVSPTRVVVTVTVARVRTVEPTNLTLFVNQPPAALVRLVPSDQTTVVLSAPRPPGACPGTLRIRVVASNGAFLTPPVTCVGR
jgi:hypothetical protein